MIYGWNGRKITWFLAVVVAAALVTAALPAGGLDMNVNGANVDKLPPPSDAPGHGNYCEIPNGGKYFYGRDFGPKVSYPKFATWCHDHGGEIGWVE
jgi:hypothetical protein